MIQIRDVSIGEGKPKISVSVCGADEITVRETAYQAAQSPAEIIDWHADTFENWKNDDALIRMLKIIRMAIGDKVLLFTFRTNEEGGNVSVKDEEYIHTLKIAVDSRLIDILDVECCVSEYRATELISYAHQKNVPVLGFNHSFNKVLNIGELEYRVRYMQKLGADIAMIVVLPLRKRDTMKLLNTTWDLCEDLDFPLAIIGQGDMGKYTRVLAEFYGTCMTSGVLNAEEGSGEIDVYRLSELIDNLYSM